VGYQVTPEISGYIAGGVEITGYAGNEQDTQQVALK